MNHRRQRGLSIVELLVGVTVGLFIVGGATALFVDYIGSNRRMLLETRINQDLRAAADIVARDLRRAGYWNGANMNVWVAGANPYSAIASSPSGITYSYERDTNSTLDNYEQVGFQRVVVNGVGILEAQVGLNNWQRLTDPAVLDVTQFTVTDATSTGTPALEIDLSTYCNCLTRVNPPPCTQAQIIASGIPKLTISRYTFVVTGRAVADPAVTRTITESVRVRNEQTSGTCPP